jgi:hypothetical protein
MNPRGRTLAKVKVKTKALAKAPEKVVAEPIPTIEVPVHYTKSPQFRTIHADGILGGLMPSGRAMNVAFYSERIPFPQEQKFAVPPDGSMIAPYATKGKKGFYREIEISAVMDYDAAKSLMDWLNKIVPYMKAMRDPNATNSTNIASGPDNAGSEQGATEGENHSADDASVPVAEPIESARRKRHKRSARH